MDATPKLPLTPGLPQPQGLYHPSMEHDSCGVGFVAHMKGKRSHQIVLDALHINNRLIHRGACGCEPNTGDGAGTFTQLPHKFLSRVASENGFDLPDEGDYGAGICFLPKDSGQQTAIVARFEASAKELGLEILGWRDVPVDSSMLGKGSASCEPHMRMVFVKRPVEVEPGLSWERKLYILRRFAAQNIRYADVAGGDYFYMPSLSSRTMVYKGMLTPEQLEDYFPDFKEPDYESALAMVHSRFSTNTFPSWPRAHPNRYMAHNGEINTLRGNVNWMHARQEQISNAVWGEDFKKVLPVCREDGSDSAMFDNVLEFLVLSGYSLPQAVMQMIPEPWEKHQNMPQWKRDFYAFYASVMEPWDGPASVSFSDGTTVGAVLDRNGLRPSRFYVTSDDLVIMASEVGVLPVEPEKVIQKGRLEPGRMFLVDMEAGRIIGDAEIKEQIAKQQPYGEYLKANRIHLSDLPEPADTQGIDKDGILQRQKAFGYSYEDLKFLLEPMSRNGIEPLGSMGNDAPLAVLSDKPKLLYNYFKQLFAQVTNPPLDAIREELITASNTFLGSEGDVTLPGPESCRMIELSGPIVDNRQLQQIKAVKREGFKVHDLPILFAVDDGGAALETAIAELCAAAKSAIEKGSNILVLSDRGVSTELAGMPALLAVAGLHHFLIREGLRTKVSLVLESGEPREVHHFALLIGYGVDAVNPYMAYETLYGLKEDGIIEAPFDEAVTKYNKAALKGVIKVMSKMGISTVASYRGAQIFEAIGLNNEFVDRYFTNTTSRIEGIGMDTVAEEVRLRHRNGFPVQQGDEIPALDPGGVYQWRHDGEYHLWNPQSIHKLQAATRTNSYDTFKQYSKLIDDQTRKLATLRGLMDFKIDPAQSIPLEEVEPVENILKRFKTGAMSYGSISKEAHEALAIAMNRIGGKSNTGEGGEDVDRFTPDATGDSRKSAIKQVASGRFGVTSHYLVHSQEMQIKIAQGAKPGEGGQLPGHKVYPEIAKVRGSTPGVGLISPPPHHDIYSIEDLAELIHDLKNANRYGRVNVKLVAEIGVGTIAAGVAKGHADVILISGHDGGTGASPLSSVHHAGAPWELGLAETNQILLLNNLRSRVVLETDGQMKTGRDIVVGALLGAEEFGMSTAPLVTLGCLMMRVCHKNTCPVGIATQDPRLRAKYRGDPEYAVRFMRFVAEEVREYMAQLGFRTLDEMVGRSDRLNMRGAVDHWKAKGVDLSRIFYRPEVGPEVGTYCQMEQDHGLDQSLDLTQILAACEPAIERGEKVSLELPIENINRVVGTITGSEISRKYGAEGLPEDTIELSFKGSAGQSFAAFTPKGMTFRLEGDANDYVGKGQSGSKLAIFPPRDRAADFVPHENIIVGNVCFYGATAGTAYIAGVAGERFCVRNSGVETVVEGVGDHGCEYMTGGKVLNLGTTGRNFAAGMSGGVAYILDEAGDFVEKRLNQEMVNVYELIEAGDAEIAEVKAMVEAHVAHTESDRGKWVLSNWDNLLPKFLKVLPKDYERMLNAFKKAEETGLTGEEAITAAFEANARDLARVSGN
ncbi:MAG: glutamate synthase large subunit [Opitutales bacterium]